MKIAFFQSASDFREWLASNHGKAHEAWVGFYKKNSGKGGISYQEAVDEALCFGWIDGLKKAVDDVSYTHRFTPRKPKSFWSAVNIKRIAELKRRGRMTAPGLKAFAGRDEQKARQYSYERSTCKLEGAHEKQFRGQEKAWEFFQAQPPGYRRTATWWVISAKREETRGKRLAKLIETSEQGRRLDMLVSQSKKKPGAK
ncbi:MAG: YdeI/OmpD-associated family protein [Candidatus Korobacteraceae bacterium]|jgi:uncharacterized protein YdeI (YjbR/CyaY-like superfamily)